MITSVVSVSLFSLLCGVAQGPVSLQSWVEGGAPVRVSAENRSVFGMRWRVPVVRTGAHRTVGESMSVPGVILDLRKVVVATGEGEVRAYNLDSGELQWRKQFDADFETRVNVLRDRKGRWCALVVDRVGGARLLDMEDGALRWQSDFGADGREAVVVAGDRLLVSTADNQLLSVDRETGEVMWRQGRSKPSGLTILGYGAPRLVSDRVITVYSDGYVVAYDSTTGKMLWERPLSLSEADFRDANATPVILGDTVYVASYSEGLYALSVANGEVQWHRRLPSVISLATSEDGLYVGSADGFVWGVSPRDGEMQFRTQVEGPVIGLNHHQGVLAFAGGQSGLVVLRAANGAPLQATSLGSRAINPPALAGKHLAMVSASGYLYSFELGAPPYNLR